MYTRAYPVHIRRTFRSVAGITRSGVQDDAECMDWPAEPGQQDERRREYPEPPAVLCGGEPVGVHRPTTT